MKLSKTPILVMLSFVCINMGFSDVIETNKWKDTLFWNNFVPGTAQMALGKNEEGWLYISSLPLVVGGTILAGFGLFDDQFFTRAYLTNHLYVTTNGKNYYWYDEAYYNKGSKWMLFSGLLLAEAGALLYAYSQYDAMREVEKRYGVNLSTSGTNKYMPLDLPGMMAAPWKPENVFCWEVLPVLPLMFVLEYSVNDWKKTGDFFSRINVPFLGYQMNPWAGLALAVSSAILFNSLVAPFEETSFRGLSLNNDGQVMSSLLFGGIHLANAVTIPNISVEDTIQQVVFATLFGLYASQKTLENGFDFQKMIAFHFWNNVIAMTLNYMINPDKQLYFSISAPIRF